MADGSVTPGITGKIGRANQHIADADAIVAILIADFHADLFIADTDPEARDMADRLARNKTRLRSPSVMLSTISLARSTTWCGNSCQNPNALREGASPLSPWTGRLT